MMDSFVYEWIVYMYKEVQKFEYSGLEIQWSKQSL